MSLVRWLAVLLTVSLVAFVIGTVAEGFWGGNSGETNWVDQSFGLAMWLGAVLTVIFAFALVVAVLFRGAVRLVRRIGR